MLLYLPIQGVIGMSAPAQNAGNVENTGFDLNISHNKRINSDFSYAVNFNVSYLKNEITNMEGTEGVDPDNAKYWRLEGHPIGSFYGYKANGYFNTPEELAKIIQPYVKIPLNELQKKLAAKRKIITVAKNLDRKTVQQIKKKNLIH